MRLVNGRDWPRGALGPERGSRSLGLGEGLRGPVCSIKKRKWERTGERASSPTQVPLRCSYLRGGCKARIKRPHWVTQAAGTLPAPPPPNSSIICQRPQQRMVPTLLGHPGGLAHTGGRECRLGLIWIPATPLKTQRPTWQPGPPPPTVAGCWAEHCPMTFSS